MLPEVRDCNAAFGTTEPSILGAAPCPSCGVAGDQQAATIGQACFAPGMVKATYGTGCFALLNTGDSRSPRSNRLLTTVAYQLDGKRTYALEGAIFIAGAAVQWLRDGLRIIASAAESGALADQSRSGTGRLPRAGLRRARCTLLAARGAWRAVRPDARYRPGRARPRGAGGRVLPDARSAGGHAQRLVGQADSGAKAVLRVDGGMVASDWTMQFLADILDAPVDRPTIGETTALGAAWLAGHKAGVWPDAQGFGRLWKLDRGFKPALTAAERERKYAGWKRAVRAVLDHASGG